MNRDEYTSPVSVLSHGLDKQNRLASLNALLSERINNSDQSSIHRMFDELLSIAEDAGSPGLAKKEERLDTLSGKLSRSRIELLKEAELLDAMRMTNDSYISALEDDITKAQEYLKAGIEDDNPDARVIYDTMEKRLQELSVTRSVGISFSEQIKYSRSNLLSLSERIRDVQMNLIPLLRGRMSAEASKVTCDALRTMIVNIFRGA